MSGIDTNHSVFSEFELKELKKYQEGKEAEMDWIYDGIQYEVINPKQATKMNIFRYIMKKLTGI